MPQKTRKARAKKTRSAVRIRDLKPSKANIKGGRFPVDGESKDSKHGTEIKISY
jgi:hypothetical protein